jgi:hypothetical protein
VLLSGVGFEGVMKGLPVLFVEDYMDLTVPQLERAHADILSRAASYNFERVTKRWWVDWMDKIKRDKRHAEAFLQEFRPVPARYERNYTHATTQLWLKDPDGTR